MASGFTLARLAADSTVEHNIIDIQRSMGLPFQRRPESVLIRITTAYDCIVSPSRIGVVKLVSSILPIVALFQVFDSLSGVAGGIMRARGKQVNFSVSCPRIDLTISMG